MARSCALQRYAERSQIALLANDNDASRLEPSIATFGLSRAGNCALQQGSVGGLGSVAVFTAGGCKILWHVVVEAFSGRRAEGMTRFHALQRL